ncbi:hypothetical protein B0H16DRAFT_1778882 [Mycena metata]|uniref:Uncharacterized protein n=1 Tax=Mycena metata TaxID=1033252 RepID=A0AAD7NPS0_9AGAR|nr:hypothetical protein B0H16DRAFT_1778882 [Mycena metata]
MEEEGMLMQAVGDEEEDAFPDDGAIEIDSDEEYFPSDRNNRTAHYGQRFMVLPRRFCRHSRPKQIVPSLAATTGNHLSFQETTHLVLVIPGLMSPIYSLSVVATATEVGALWLLPYAYYCAATYPAEELLPFMDGRFGQHVLKSLAAYVSLAKAQLSFKRFFLQRTSCEISEQCNEARDEALSGLFDAISDCSLDPMGEVAEEAGAGMCEPCCKAAEEQQRAASQAFYNELPAICGRNCTQ